MKSFQEITTEIQTCQRCELHKYIRNYVPGILGTRDPGFVVIGEAPGYFEDVEGVPFIGKSGKILDAAMHKVFGFNRGDYTILNSVKCRPPENRDPNKLEKQQCRFWLTKQLAALKPSVVICLGKHGSMSATQKNLTMTQFREEYYTCANIKADFIPTFHPIATVYTNARRKDFMDDLKSIKDGSYKAERRNVRCKIVFNEPENLDGCGLILP